ncbi:Microtubule-associated protein, microtubule dynamics during spindle orientation, partial [Rhizophlyctis rosea]
MAAPEEDFSSLPLMERLTHKVWKARLGAYEEATKIFNTLDPDADAEYRKYQEFLKKMIADSNLVAQEAGMAAVLAWVTNAPSATKTRSVIVPMVVDKGLGSTRAGTKAKALEILLMYIEIDIAEPVIEDIIPGIDHKTPKNVVGAVSSLRESLRLFGHKVIPVKVLLKQLPKIFDHKDKNVRAEGTALALELYRWLGPAISNSLTDLKPVQLKELNEQFETLPNERPIPDRLLRSEQAKIEANRGQMGDSTNEASHGGQDDAAAQEPEDIDPYDLADPINILDKLPKNFYEDLASTKWKERKEALDALLALLNAPKLEDGRYGELISILAKKVNDANLLVVINATNSIEKIAVGLRQSFAQYKSIVTHPLLEKCKEKKTNVVEALRGALDAVFASVTIAEIVEDVTGSAAHKNPQVRQEAILWLVRCLKTTRKAPKKEEIKAVSDSLIKALDDSVDTVREAAAEALGTLMKVVSERMMASHLEKLEKLKETKVREYFDKAEVKCVGGGSAAARKLAGVAAGGGGVRASQPAMPKEVAALAAKPVRPTSAPVSAPALPKASAAGPAAKKRTTIAVSHAPAVAKGKKEAPKDDGPVSYKFSDDGAEAAVVEVVGEETFKQLGDANWKVRLAAVQDILEKIKQADPSSVEAEAFVMALAKKPGWKENNFQVTTNFFHVVQHLAKEVPSFNKAAASIVVPGLAEKLGDMKVKKAAGDCLTAVAETTSLQYVLANSYDVIKKQKAPKVIADSLMWIQQTLLEFGTAGVALRDIIDFAKWAIGNTNQAVRTNAITVLGTVRMFAGPDIRSFVQDVNPQTLALIDAEFEKAAAKAPPQPSKSSKATEGDVAADPTDDLFPRVDISGQITHKIIEELGDANWKVRKDALDEVLRIVEATNKRIKPNLGNELMPALKGRLNDSNRNLAINAVELCGILATAMGKPFEKQVRTVIGPMTSLLADQKAHVRGAALSALDKVYEACGLDALISSFASSLMPDQPQLRKDLLKWLADQLEKTKDALPDLSSMVHPILLCLQDRNAEVRKSAQTILAFVAQQVKPDIIREKCGDLFKGAALASVIPFVDALPGAARAAPAAAPAASARPGTPKRAGPGAAGGSNGLPLPKSKLPPGMKARPGSLATTLSLKKDLPPTEETPSPSTGFRDAPILTSDPKAKDLRAASDKGMQKWTFDSPRRELIDFLEEQCSPHFASEVHAWMFSTDHYKEKDYLSALSAIDEPINPSLNVNTVELFGLDQRELRARYVANVDLVLKYITLRFFDTNTSMLIKCLDVLEHLFNVLDEEGLYLGDYEAGCFLPFFIAKAGDNKETMRAKIRGILKQIARIYPASKLFSYLLRGIESKNSRTRTECLEELASLIQRFGVSVCAPSKAFPIIASQLADRDAGVRNGALSAITQAYLLVGSGVWKYIGKISEKDKSLVEERLKRLPPGAAQAAAATAAKAGGGGGERDTRRIGGLAGTAGVGVGDEGVGERLPPGSPGMKRSVVSAASANGPAGIRKEFSLDLDKLDMPSRAQQQSFRPQQRSVSAASATSYASGRTALTSEDRAFSVSMDVIMTQVISTDPTLAIDGVKQLEKIIASSTELALPHVNEIVPGLTLQIRLAFTASDVTSAGVSRLCKHLINVLVQIFSVPELARALGKGELHTCIFELLHRLLDPVLQQLDQGQQLARALNMLMVRVLDNAGRNDCFSILLDILAKSSMSMRNLPADQLETHSKFTELAMKCVWKMTKVISKLLQEKQLAADRLLLDVHTFLLALPPSEWKRRTAEKVIPNADMPFRTVKTILHELVNSLGEGVLGECGLIADPGRSHAVSYLKQMLQTERKRSLGRGEGAGSGRGSEGESPTPSDGAG